MQIFYYQINIVSLINESNSIKQLFREDLAAVKYRVTESALYLIILVLLPFLVDQVAELELTGDVPH